MQVVLTDRVVNPVDEGFDLAIAAFDTTFGGVVDIPLCPLRRQLPSELWVKALVPEARLQTARVRALSEFLKESFYPTPPWARSVDAGHAMGAED